MIKKKETKKKKPDTRPLMFVYLEEAAKLIKEKKRLDKELKTVKKKLAATEAGLMEQFTQEGIQNINAHSLCFYMKTETRVSVLKGAREAAVEVACELGLEAHICLQSRSFGAWGKEQIEAAIADAESEERRVELFNHPEFGLPEQIRPFVNVFSQPVLRTRKA